MDALAYSGGGIEKAGNVTFIGVLKDQNILAAIYSIANVFVLFSQKETYSLTCAEALCCGTPIVGFRCGAPETVFGGGCSMGKLCRIWGSQGGSTFYTANDKDGGIGEQDNFDSDGIRASVAMAVYNGEQFINEQIDSILQMLGEHDELIISYDESTDNTWDIIKAYADSDKRIKVVNDNGRSVESNFNNAVRHCRGSYIFLADQDDVWINNKIDRFTRDFEENSDVVIVIGDGYITDADLNKTDSLFFKYHIKTGSLQNLIKGTYLGCQMAFRTSIRDKVWPVPVQPSLPHDLWLGVVGGLYGSIYLDRSKTILHRVHEKNYSNTSKMNFIGVVKNRAFFLRSIIKQVVQNSKKGK